MRCQPVGGTGETASRGGCGGGVRVGRKVAVDRWVGGGVVAEGVSAYPQVITGEMVKTFLRGGAGINVLARPIGADVRVALAGHGAAPQFINLMVYGNATLSMPSAWPASRFIGGEPMKPATKVLAGLE